MQAVCALWALAMVSQATPIPLPQALVAPPCVACRADVERERAAFSADEWKTLSGGGVVSSEVHAESAGDSEQGRVLAAGIIRHPPEHVWAVLTDFESRPRYMSSTKEIRIVRVDRSRVWVAQHLGFFLVDVRYVVVNTLEPERGAISWVLDESAPHDIAGTQGSWQLTPLAERRETLLTYRTWVDTGRAVPQFVEKFLLQRSLPRVISEIRGEVDARSQG